MAKLRITGLERPDTLVITGYGKLEVNSAAFLKGFEKAGELSLMIEFDKYPRQPFKIRLSAPANVHNPKSKRVNFNGYKGTPILIPKECQTVSIYLEKQPSFEVDLTLSLTLIS